MQSVRYGRDQCFEEAHGGWTIGLLMQGDEGEFRGSVNRDEQVELALCCSNLSDVDMEIADRVGFEFSFFSALSFSTCGRREMPCRFRQRCNDDRVRCGIVACSAYRRSSSGSKVCRRNAVHCSASDQSADHFGRSSTIPTCGAPRGENSEPCETMLVEQM